MQVVEPTPSVAYPVLADPDWIWWGAGYGMRLTRGETRQAGNYAMAGAMCAAFLKRAPGVGVACGVYAGYIASQAGIANGEQPQTCLFFNVVPAPGSIWRLPCP